MHRNDKRAITCALMLTVLLVLLFITPGCAGRGSGFWPDGDPWPNVDYALPGSPTCAEGCGA